jgi:hypothetical protein
LNSSPVCKQPKRSTPKRWLSARIAVVKLRTKAVFVPPVGERGMVAAPIVVKRSIRRMVKILPSAPSVEIIIPIKGES